MTTVTESYDYSVGADPRTGRGGITRSSAPRPERFTWGSVQRVHTIGDDYAIVEYIPTRASNVKAVKAADYDPSPQFSVFVRGAHGTSWDTSHSYGSLDKALIACVAWRAEQRQGGFSAAANSRAVRYIAQMLGLDQGGRRP